MGDGQDFSFFFLWHKLTKNASTPLCSCRFRCNQCRATGAVQRYEHVHARLHRGQFAGGDPRLSRSFCAFLLIVFFFLSFSFFGMLYYLLRISSSSSPLLIQGGFYATAANATTAAECCSACQAAAECAAWNFKDTKRETDCGLHNVDFSKVKVSGQHSTSLTTAAHTARLCRY